MALRDLDAHELGVSWTIDELQLRTSHALVQDGRVWLVDPVDEPEALERVAGLGTPEAVLQLLGRHNRDGAAIAERLGVPLLPLPEELPGTPFTVVPLLRVPWREVGLWWPERRALVVPEALGTGPLFAVGPGPVGVHPILRLRPPGALTDHAPAHLLVGHGPPVHGPETPRHIRDALDRSRRDLPRLLPAIVRAVRS